jgi:hypothetical protein
VAVEVGVAAAAVVLVDLEQRHLLPLQLVSVTQLLLVQVAQQADSEQAADKEITQYFQLSHPQAAVAVADRLTFYQIIPLQTVVAQAVAVHQEAMVVQVTPLQHLHLKVILVVEGLVLTKHREVVEQVQLVVLVCTILLQVQAVQELLTLTLVHL